MYENLSQYYDIFMNDVPYDDWTAYIEKHLKKGSSGMDIGCGTGAFTLRLNRDGYVVTGVDISAQMLEIATKNAKKERLSVNFACMSAENFIAPRPLDFITANCDVVNYLKNPQKFFERAFNELKDDGVLIFDISSAYKLKMVLGNQVYTQTEKGITYIWENFYDSKKKSVDIKMTFFAPNGNSSYCKSEDYQTQYAFEREQIERLLLASGFKSVKVFGFLSDGEPRKNEERLHFIAYKK